MATEPAYTASPLGRRSVAIALWLALGVISIVLVWRRLAGAFTAELSPLAACVFPTLAAAGGVAAWVLSGGGTTGGLAARVTPAAATLGPVLLLGIALCPAGASAAVAYLTVVLLLTAASLWALSQFVPPPPTAAAAEPRPWAQDELLSRDPALAIAVRRTAHPTPPTSPPDATRDSPAAHDANGAPGAPAVSQWVRREVNGDARERIEGGARLAFAPGQKHAALHLAFMPPLAGVPVIECEPLDSADVELRVAAVYAYGARIEARRDAADEPIEVEIGYVAQSPEPSEPLGRLAEREFSPHPT